MAFLQDYWDKKLNPYYRSGKIDDFEVSKEKVFYNLVSKNYNKMVKDSEYGLMLLICISSFDHCAEMKKSLRQIGNVLLGYGKFFYQNSRKNRTKINYSKNQINLQNLNFSKKL